jgi:hypothetical protein
MLIFITLVNFILPNSQTIAMFQERMKHVKALIERHEKLSRVIESYDKVVESKSVPNVFHLITNNSNSIYCYDIDVNIKIFDCALKSLKEELALITKQLEEIVR